MGLPYSAYIVIAFKSNELEHSRMSVTRHDINSNRKSTEAISSLIASSHPLAKPIPPREGLKLECQEWVKDDASGIFPSSAKAFSLPPLEVVDRAASTQPHSFVLSVTCDVTGAHLFWTSNRLRFYYRALGTSPEEEGH